MRVGLMETLNRTWLTITRPQWTEFRQALRWPAQAKLVILNSSNPLIDNLIKRQFKDYQIIDAKQVIHQNREDVSQNIADKLLEAGVRHGGGMLYNYPTSPVEALELDLLLDGVNLAIHVKFSSSMLTKIAANYHHCAKCGQVFNHALHFITPTQPGFETNCNNTDECKLQSIEVDTTTHQEVKPELLEYYSDKGLLYELEIDEKMATLRSSDFHELLQRSLTTNIKI